MHRTKKNGNTLRQLGINPRKLGISSRKLGISPRQLGQSPRQLGLSPRQLEEKAAKKGIPVHIYAAQRLAKLRELFDADDS
jgi:hypothetical protein